MSATHPQTVAEWAVFLEYDPMPLRERLRFVSTLGYDQRNVSADLLNSAEAALLAIIPGDGQTTPTVLDAVAEATGRPRIREGQDGVINTAPAARAALRRWAARQ